VAGAEQVLRAILERDPSQAESWANLAKLLRNQGRLPETAEVCRQGRTHCPWDADLVLLHGLALQDLGDFRGAEACLLEVLERDAAGPNLGGAAKARSARARHHLALLYRQYRPADAEAQWRAALQLKPESMSAWLGLGELYLDAGRWPELEEVVTRLATVPAGAMEETVLRARGHLARNEFDVARRLMEELLDREPRAEWPLVILSYALLQEGKDLDAAEQILRRILDVNPANAEARRNLPEWDTSSQQSA
jgi:tetratricopeptide (TPR) repeat protein